MKKGMPFDHAEINSALNNFHGEVDIELTPVVLKQSDLYPAAHFRLAILCALSVSLAMYYLPWPWTDPIWFLWAQVPALALGYFLAYRQGIKRIFSTSAELNEETHQKALEIYHARLMDSDNGKPKAIVLFSQLEKRIELVMDQKLRNSITPKEFNDLIKEVAKTTKTQGVTKGLVQLIGRLEEKWVHLFASQIEAFPAVSSNDVEKDKPRETNSPEENPPPQETGPND